jgi:hypothetical protein
MRSALLTAAAAVILLPAAASAQQRPAAPAAQRSPAQQAQPLQVPQAQTMLVLINTTLIAFNQANLTNVYHVFHGLGSDRFRATNSPDALSKSFAAFRQRNIDLSAVILTAPQLSRQPAIEQGRLHLAGFYPTNPTRVIFDMYFEPSQGRWKLAQFSVSLAPAPAAAAPGAQQQQARPQQQPTGR